MAAALPYVDEFVEGHSLDALERLVAVLNRGLHRPCVSCSTTSTAGARPASGWRSPASSTSKAPGHAGPGAAMAVNEDGEVAGSVSGGCVEGAVVAEALAVLAGETEPRVVTFGYSDDEAFSVGLTCGGTIHLYLEAVGLVARVTLFDELAARLRAEQPVALVTVVSGPHVRRQAARLAGRGAARHARRSGARSGRGTRRARRAGGRPVRCAPLRTARRDDARGPRRFADRRGVRRLPRGPTADVDLRRRRLHRRPRQGRQAARLPGHRVRRPRGVRHPSAIPDGRRGARHVAGTAVRRAWRRRWAAATPCASSPTTPSSTSRRDRRAGDRRRATSA